MSEAIGRQVSKQSAQSAESSLDGAHGKAGRASSKQLASDKPLKEQLDEVLALNDARAQHMESPKHSAKNWTNNGETLANYFTSKKLGREFASRGNVFYQGEAGRATAEEKSKVTLFNVLDMEDSDLVKKENVNGMFSIFAKLATEWVPKQLRVFLQDEHRYPHWQFLYGRKADRFVHASEEARELQHLTSANSDELVRMTSANSGASNDIPHGMSNMSNMSNQQQLPHGVSSMSNGRVDALVRHGSATSKGSNSKDKAQMTDASNIHLLEDTNFTYFPGALHLTKFL
jgi:hypothetical protein